MVVPKFGERVSRVLYDSEMGREGLAGRCEAARSCIVGVVETMRLRAYIQQ